ncbi:ABC transporter substrate-binding protein [Paenibacillus sp. y28]|uniref:ABC transporter substrate-binding protein n=1 Tax=Paenibacillus sp. y28 TaxID=3129110 RepID=UPI003019703A
MKKTMRIGTLSCIMMLTASMMLSACDTSTSSTGSQSTPAAAGDGNKQLATIKLVYPGSPQADEAKIEEAINQKLASTLNAKLDIMPIDWGQWENKINLMIASREPVDIIFTAQWNGHAINVSKGAFLPLNDDSLPKHGNLLKQYGKGITDSLDPIFLEGAKINGKNYGVPTNKELAAQGGVIYREDIAKELNLDMSKVKKIEDLEAVLSAVKEKKPELTPLFLRDGDNLNSHYFSQYDYLGDSTIPGVILKDDTSTKVVPKYELPRYKEIVNATRNLMKKGLVNKDAATTPLSGQDAMKAGNVFMITGSLKPGKDAEMASVIGLQGKLKQIDMTERTISTGETAGSMLGISSASADPAKAMQFINLLHTDKELNNLLNFGIEGTHYVKTSGDIIKAGPQYKGYSPGAAWQFGSQFLNYIWDNEDPKKWEQFRAFNKDAKKSPGLGFTFNAEPVKTEVAAAANIVKEFDPGLDTGSVEPDTVLPKYMEKLKASGQDKIIAEKQKQFDSYLSTKK